MSIYKLIEICSINSSTNSISNNNYGKFPVYGASGEIMAMNDKPFSNSSYISLLKDGASAGRVHYFPGKSSVLGTLQYIIPNENIVKRKYLFYLLNGIPFKNFITGTTIPHIYFKDWNKLEVMIPDIIEQQKIIDIIEQFDSLFLLRYIKLIRIDTLENAKNDVKKLIDIIEPLEKMKLAMTKIKEKIFFLLKKNYIENKNNIISLNEIIQSISNKYNNQSLYYATNAIGTFLIDTTKIQNITIKKPSRANITVPAKTIIISKLLGENKFYYFDEEPSEVMSTGMFNIKTEYVDHFIGFLLSGKWIEQKNSLANGTTMVGLNNKEFLKVKIKIPNNNDKILSQLIYKANKMEYKLDLLIKKNISLLLR